VLSELGGDGLHSVTKKKAHLPSEFSLRSTRDAPATRASLGSDSAIYCHVCSSRKGRDIPKRLPTVAGFGRHPNSSERALKEIPPWRQGLHLN
jgi:hypothetical protein